MSKTEIEIVEQRHAALALAAVKEAETAFGSQMITNFDGLAIIARHFAAFESRLASQAEIIEQCAKVVPQWRCINCKHVVTSHLKPNNCPSCRWCVGFAEVAALSRPVPGREEIARIIDPEAFAFQDVRPLNPDNKSIADYKVEAAIVKADAIILALGVE